MRALFRIGDDDLDATQSYFRMHERAARKIFAISRRERTTRDDYSLCVGDNSNPDTWNVTTMK